MQPINRQIFFAAWRREFGSLTQQQVDGLNVLLSMLEADKYVTDIRWGACMLGTTYHETAKTMQPIHEHGSRAYFIGRYGSQTKVGKVLGNDTPEEGADYAGWGDVQLTGENNYEAAEAAMRKYYPDVVARFEERTGRKFDLTVGDQPGDSADPANAGDPEIAYCIMSHGMRTGMFTGVGLKRYIHDDVCDYFNSRKIINGLDCAKLIAGYCVKIEMILREATA